MNLNNRMIILARTYGEGKQFQENTLPITMDYEIVTDFSGIASRAGFNWILASNPDDPILQQYCETMAKEWVARRDELDSRILIHPRYLPDTSRRSK